MCSKRDLVSSKQDLVSSKQDLSVNLELFLFLSQNKNMEEHKSEMEDLQSQINRLEEQLQSERAFTRLYLDQTENIVVLVSNDEKIHLVNRPANTLFGYSREELLGKNWFDLAVDKEARETERKNFQDIMNGGRQLFKQASENKVITSRGIRDILWSIRIHLAPNGKPIGQLMIGQDITEEKKSKEQINYMAYHDQLTGLKNRAYLMTNLQSAIERAQKQSWSVGLLFMDFDNFKYCNDTYGHAAGDELLQQISTRLQRISRPSDLLARLGGDEFVMVLPDVSMEFSEARRQSTVVAKRIREAFAAPFELNVEGKLVEHISQASIGISLFPFDSHSADEILSNADHAMYFSKKTSSHQYSFYSDISKTNAPLQLSAAKE